MNPGTNRRGRCSARRVSPRISSVHELLVTYEGYSEPLVTRPLDLSTHGMFINTARKFPEGAVLNVQFRLAISGAEIQARCEVRYCLAGVGVGLEFIGISPKSVRAIEKEIGLCRSQQPRKKSLTRK